ncbi:MAG: putative riboflavin transport system substrate-binding protein [Chloroflexota bacterium]|nr:putative riboflavin transport system substrate-binding protein [Chloroflexota bacterium]
MRRWCLAVVSVVALVVGCGPGGPTTEPLTKLTVGLGYIASVQFAQFYRAQVQGYYADAGLEVTFQNGNDAQLITLIAQGVNDIGIADGTSVIPAVGQGIHIRYVATIYARFPNVVITGADSGINSVGDLRGKSIGIPGAYGSSWIMLQALLSSAGMTTDDISERDYPDYGQGVALQQGQVEAATGYRNNEPVQLGLAGFETRQFTVDDVVPLPGPGLIVGEATLASKRDALAAFIAATLRAMREIDESPEAGLEDAIALVPELAADRATQLAILEATIEMWHSPTTDSSGLGAIDEGGWNYSLSFMKDLPGSNIPDRVTVEDLIDTELLP